MRFAEQHSPPYLFWSEEQQGVIRAAIDVSATLVLMWSYCMHVTLLSRFASPGRGWLYTGLRIDQRCWYCCFIGLVKWCFRIGRASLVQVGPIQRWPRLQASVCIVPPDTQLVCPCLRACSRSNTCVFSFLDLPWTFRVGV